MAQSDPGRKEKSQASKSGNLAPESVLTNTHREKWLHLLCLSLETSFGWIKPV